MEKNEMSANLAQHFQSTPARSENWSDSSFFPWACHVMSHLSIPADTNL